MATMRCWARVSFAPATIFMARVIFCVALVLAMRLRIALSEGTGLFSSVLLLLGLVAVRRRRLRSAAAERGPELVEGLLQDLFGLVVEDLLGPQRLVDLRVL